MQDNASSNKRSKGKRGNKNKKRGARLDLASFTQATTPQKYAFFNPSNQYTSTASSKPYGDAMSAVTSKTQTPYFDHHQGNYKSNVFMLDFHNLMTLHFHQTYKGSANNNYGRHIDDFNSRRGAPPISYCASTFLRQIIGSFNDRRSYNKHRWEFGTFVAAMYGDRHQHKVEELFKDLAGDIEWLQHSSPKVQKQFEKIDERFVALMLQEMEEKFAREVVVYNNGVVKRDADDFFVLTMHEFFELYVGFQKGGNTCLSFDKYRAWLIQMLHGKEINRPPYPPGAPSPVRCKF